METNDKVFLTFIQRNMEFRFENYGLNQKIKNALNKGFIFTGIVIVTIFFSFKSVECEFISLSTTSNANIA